MAMCFAAPTGGKRMPAWIAREELNDDEME